MNYDFVQTLKYRLQIEGSGGKAIPVKSTGLRFGRNNTNRRELTVRILVVERVIHFPGLSSCPRVVGNLSAPRRKCGSRPSNVNTVNTVICPVDRGSS